MTRYALLGLASALLLAGCGTTPDTTPDPSAALVRDICGHFTRYTPLESSMLVNEWAEIERTHPEWLTGQYVIDQTALRDAVKDKCP